jgi:NADH:ubiquinone oxidoreductase subunit D/NADH:ubiquinone oxidoreductase subunit C
MSLTQMETAIQARLPDAHVEWDQALSTGVLTVHPSTLLSTAEMLRDEPELRFDLLLAGTRLGGQMCYQLVSTVRQQRLRLQVTSSGGETSLPSLAFVWPSANWIERECHDTSALLFAGHPDPGPLLRPVHLALPIATDEALDTFFHGTRYLTCIDGLSLALESDEGQVAAVLPELGRRHVDLGSHLTRHRYTRGTALSARLDGFAALSCDLAYALAVEALLGVEVPPRASVLRSLYAELARLASHLFWLARWAADAAGPSFVGPSYALQGRSEILSLFEWLSGNPVLPDLIAIGGLEQDAPAGLADAVHQVTSRLTEWLDDLDRLMTRGGNVRSGLRGLGVIDAGTAVGLGVTGPCLRATGAAYDVRRAFPYAGYAQVDVRVPTRDDGDAAARCEIRLAEMRCSVDLVQQCLALLVDGPVNAFGTGDPPAQVPAGTAYAAVEGPRGELGVLAEANDSARLESVYVRGPSFANLSALPFLAPGTSLSKLRILVDSLDLSAGEIER